MLRTLLLAKSIVHESSFEQQLRHLWLWMIEAVLILIAGGIYFKRRSIKLEGLNE